MPLSSSQGAELIALDKTSIPLYPLTIIGRDATRCNMTFPDDERVSRVHVRIEEQGSQWRVTDLNSSNGTFVNGNRISTPIALQPGDQIGIGRSIYIFNIPGMAPIIPQSPQHLMPFPAQSAPPAVIPPVGQQPLAQPWGPTPVQQAPSGGWRSWNKPPIIEGYVRFISERYMMKKDDLLKRGIAAAALAVFISPALAFLPFMRGNDIAARDMRVEDRLSNRMVDVKMLGDVMGNINQSDAVAVWGQVQGGLLLMEAAFNYATETIIQVKR